MVGAALLLGATLLGRRAPVGFVALFIGASFAQSILFLALPFFALAFWLLYRSFRVQKEITASMRAARAESGSSSPTAAGRRRARHPPGPHPPGRSSARAPTPAKKRSKGPVGPTPNKRYTPKAPTPPPPPPPKLSRKERKAAASQD